MKMVSVGNTHACAILDNDQLNCWGDNASGQLGVGDMARRGDQPGEMGDARPAVSLGTSRFAKAVYVATGFTCAILDNSTVHCWGSNHAGQLGLGDVNARGDAQGEMGDSLPTVHPGTGRTVLSMSNGVHSSCALLDNRSFKCWGGNNHGQLGIGTTAARGDGPGEMGDTLPIVRFGSALVPKMPDPAAPLVPTFFQGENACVILHTGQIKCWGLNATGELGVGDAPNRGDAPGEMDTALPIALLGPEI